MQSIGPALGFLLICGIYGIFLWIVWKFYRALARIGEELSEINAVLRERLPRPEPGAPARFPQ